MELSFSSALISGVVPPFLTTCFSPGQPTGMLLPLQQRGSWGMQETSQALALVSLPPFIPGVANGRIFKPAHWSFTWWYCRPMSAVPCSLGTGFDGPQALLSLCEHGWRGLDYTVQSINPEKIGHRVMGRFFNYRRNKEVSKLYLLFQHRFSSA